MYLSDFIIDPTQSNSTQLYPPPSVNMAILKPLTVVDIMMDGYYSTLPCTIHIIITKHFSNLFTGIEHDKWISEHYTTNTQFPTNTLSIYLFRVIQSFNYVLCDKLSIYLHTFK